ncbi:MAG: LacI family DNA-binding transcriptional regulator [Muricomes sp.]
MAATMKDIAKKTGLGLATISSYLNGGNVREKNRIKIEEAIEELHFEVNEVARGLKTNKTKTIGVIIPELNMSFCTRIITEVEDLLRSRGYATIICDCRSDGKREEEAVEFLFHRRVDGLIIMPSGKNGKHLNRFIRAGKPVVMIDRKLEGIDCDCVLVDNEWAARDAVERLITAGHKRIGLIAGPRDIYTAKRRYQGYCAAMEKAGFLIEEKLIARGDYTIEGGAAAMKRLVRQNPDMTAVFVSNYEMTMGAIIEINELGIEIPKQLSFIGFDNVEFAKANTPRLNVVIQPTREIAGHVSELMLRRLEENGNQGKREIICLKTSFVKGKSVKEEKVYLKP